MSTSQTPGDNLMPEFQRLCHIDEIPRGEARMFRVGELTLAIFHVAGGLFAMENDCPHAGASLAHGYIENGVVSCRIHHWRFQIENGAYLDEDRPECNRATFPVRLLGQWVEVAI